LVATTVTKKTLALTEDLHRYLVEVSVREPPILGRLRQETAPQRWAQMQVAPEQGQFMALLARLIGARRYLEIGVFTGYSSLAVALAMPDDGQLVACDISEEWTEIAQRYWLEAGVRDRIDLRLAPALDTLESLRESGRRGSFDFAFVDADKENYPAYYEAVLDLLRPGGLLAVDNVLWGGSVIDPGDTSRDTEAIRRFNRDLLADERVDISMVPIGDGLTLARKRA
jgi:caffeoyl-CoA O-methyltransferase